MDGYRDFDDLLRCFIDANVDFLVVGAHALAIYDRPRATKDLDVWVRPTSENADRVWHGLTVFGAPLDRVTRDDLTSVDMVFQIGIAPIRIDILTSITGVTFDEAWPHRVLVTRAGMSVPHIGIEAYLRNKDATGRDQDRIDAAAVRARLGRSSSTGL